MAETRRKFDQDFKEGAVRLVRETGKPVAQVAKDLGINEGTLGNWVNADRRRRGDGTGSWVRMSGRSWPGCARRTPSWRWSVMCSSAGGPLGQGRDGAVAVAALIAAQRDRAPDPARGGLPGAGGVPVLVLQEEDGELPPRAARRAALAAEVRRLFAAHRGTYGSPRITADLRDAGWRVSKNTVAAVMAEQGLAARRKKQAQVLPGLGRAAGGRRTWSSGTSPRGRSTPSGTATGRRSRPVRASSTSPRSWTWPPGGCSGSRWASIMTRQLAYGALAMAVAVRGGAVPGVIMHYRLCRGWR